MSTIPYEILIRGNNGAFQGAHAIDAPADQPRAITTEDLASLAPSINAASLAFVAGIEAEHAAAIAAKDAEIAQLTSDYAELSAYKTAMEERVSTVLQSNDPAQYVALAEDFLTPAQEKAQQEKLARIAALKAEAAALEAELVI
jgi:hypothetical protein